MTNVSVNLQYVYSTSCDPLIYPRVHLACGTRYLDGWINVDIRDDVGADQIADVTKGLPFDTASIHTLYFSHGLEHILPSELPYVLNEICRVMAPGGVLYLAVPDMREIASLILEGVYMQRLMGPILGRRDYPENTHHHLFTFEYLAMWLHKHGFHSIEQYDFTLWQPGEHDDFSKSYLNGRLISLNVKAVR